MSRPQHLRHGKSRSSPTSHGDTLIPDRPNFFLVILVFSIALGLLYPASRVESWWLVVHIGAVFSYLLLTNYALLHEASHGNLQSSSRRNYWLGVMAGFLFRMPFTMMCSTHQGHHDHNRTDVEMSISAKFKTAASLNISGKVQHPLRILLAYCAGGCA